MKGLIWLSIYWNRKRRRIYKNKKTIEEEKKEVETIEIGGIKYSEEEVKEEYKGNISLANPNPEAVLKVKSLEDLKVRDEVISPIGIKNKIKKIIEKKYILSNYVGELTLQELNDKGFIIYTNQIKEMSPSEAETLLEEKLGIKVKIK